MTTNNYVTQKDQFLLTSLPFNKRPFCSNRFELCNLMRVGRKQHILSTTFNLRRYRRRFLKSSVLQISLQNQKDDNAKSFVYVTGLKNISFNAIEVGSSNRQYSLNATRLDIGLSYFIVTNNIVRKCNSI
jgi:hypothetical protein